MDVIFMSVAIVTMCFSALALIISVACYIKIKATELSKYEFVPMTQEQMFETDIDKINKEVEEDKLDKEVDDAFEPHKINEVIL